MRSLAIVDRVAALLEGTLPFRRLPPEGSALLSTGWVILGNLPTSSWI
jgi:hypothetical protein